MREVWLAGWMLALETAKEGKSLDELLRHAEDYYQNGIEVAGPNHTDVSSYDLVLPESSGVCQCGKPGKLMVTLDGQKGCKCLDCLTAMRNDSFS